MTNKYQISQNGSVVNTVIATEEFVQSAYPSETYEVTLVVTEVEVRAERDKRLLEMDALLCNPIRWGLFDDTTQAEWATYRQALLDVPQQDGFPNTVTWPDKP